MASEIRVNTINNRSGLGTISINDSGASFSGVVTATGGFSGDLTGNVTSSSTSTFTNGLNVTGGDVGIGTDGPTTKLEIQSSANDSLDNPQTIFLRDRNTAGEGKGPGLTFGFDYSASGSYINRAGQIKCIKENSTDNNYASALIFGTTAHATSTTEKLRITSGGNVQIANGNLVFSTAGTGIDFSAAGNVAGMTSELLDDYEEGTFTASFGGTTYTTTGYYTKVGRLVYVNVSTGAMNVTSSSPAQVFGLPFTVREQHGVAAITHNTYTNNNGGNAVITLNSTVMTCTLANSTAYTNTNITASAYLMIAGCYVTDT